MTAPGPAWVLFRLPIVRRALPLESAPPDLDAPTLRRDTRPTLRSGEARSKQNGPTRMREARASSQAPSRRRRPYAAPKLRGAGAQRPSTSATTMRSRFA